MAPVVVDGVVLRIRPGIKQVINRSEAKSTIALTAQTIKTVNNMTQASQL
jgi:hypothetical protein